MRSTFWRVRISILTLVLAGLVGMVAGNYAHCKSLQASLDAAAASRVDEVKGLDIGDVRFTCSILKPYVLFGEPEGHIQYYTSKRTEDGGYEYGGAEYKFIRWNDRWEVWDRALTQGEIDTEPVRMLFGHPPR